MGKAEGSWAWLQGELHGRSAPFSGESPLYHNELHFLSETRKVWAHKNVLYFFMYVIIDAVIFEICYFLNIFFIWNKQAMRTFGISFMINFKG